MILFSYVLGRKIAHQPQNFIGIIPVRRLTFKIVNSKGLVYKALGSISSAAINT